jgi:hypothetical protein
MAHVATRRPGQVAQDAPEEPLFAIRLGVEKRHELHVVRKGKPAIEQKPKLVEEAGTILRTSKAWSYGTPWILGRRRIRADEYLAHAIWGDEKL